MSAKPEGRYRDLVELPEIKAGPDEAAAAKKFLQAKRLEEARLGLMEVTEAERHIKGHCPHCGSTAIVHRTPVVAGPDGWGGGRCKACGWEWFAVDLSTPLQTETLSVEEMAALSEDPQ